MTATEYDRASEKLLGIAEDIENAKRPAYTQGDTDVLKNLKESARRMGVTPMQAWGVYFNKHIDAINAFAKDPYAPQAEDILGRFADAVNYLKLGWALVEEYRAEPEGEEGKEGLPQGIRTLIEHLLTVLDALEDLDPECCPGCRNKYNQLMSLRGALVQNLNDEGVEVSFGD